MYDLSFDVMCAVKKLPKIIQVITKLLEQWIMEIMLCCCNMYFRTTDITVIILGSVTV